MLVTPAATARLSTNWAETMTAVAVGVGVSSSLIGLTFSYHLATPPGPTIALVTVAWFAGAALVARRPRQTANARSAGPAPALPEEHSGGGSTPHPPHPTSNSAS